MGCGVSSTSGSPAAQYKAPDDGDAPKAKKGGGIDEQLLEMIKQYMKENPDMIPGGGTPDIKV